MKRFTISVFMYKDLAQTVRNPKFPMAIGAYLMLLSALGISTLTGIFSGQENFINLKNGFIVLYKMLLGFQYALLIFIIPAITANAISGERENRTLDVMLSTTMNPYKIVTGKLFCAITKIMLYAIASLPVIALVYVVGIIDFCSIFEFFLVLFFTTFFLGSFGILMSVIFLRTSTATIVTYAGMLLVLVGTISAVLLDDLFFRSSTHLDLLDYSLLFNPIATIYVMLSEQLGMIGKGFDLIVAGTVREDFIIKNWLKISLSFQVLIGVFNILLSGYLLNPLKKK